MSQVSSRPTVTQGSPPQGSPHQDSNRQGHLRCNILTAFPEAVRPYFESGITGRAIERGLKSRGVACSVRVTRGQERAGACGQLAIAEGSYDAGGLTT